MRRRFVLLTLNVWRDEASWAGECTELGTATDGDSPDQVFEELSDLTMLTVETLENSGQLERVLREQDVKVYTDELPSRVEVPAQVVAPNSFFQLKEQPLASVA